MTIIALPDLMIEPIVRAALLEDLGRAGDLTAQAVITADDRFSAVFAARQAGVVAGIDCARLAMTLMGASFETLLPDGSAITSGDVIARVDGPAAAVLAGERVALNLLCHLSGVASQTAAYVTAIAGTGVRIAETRKTMPGLRGLQKHAVKCGGGINHRFGLDDAILIKDNHIAICGGVATAMKRARAAAGHLVKIEVEVDSLDQLREALPFAPDVVLLDNFALDDLRAAVASAKGKTVLEASGGINMTTVRAIAETGVDVISIGALTHSVPNFDIGLDAA
jgi:nicotinate-nucleotide pyrophosphorylase (carboxylating)